MPQPVDRKGHCGFSLGGRQLHLDLGGPQVGQTQKSLAKGHGRVLISIPTTGWISTMPGGGGEAETGREGSIFHPTESGDGVADAGAAAMTASAVRERRLLNISCLQVFTRGSAGQY
mgnify:CR=1 FL=1